MQAQEFALLARLHLGRIVGVIEAQAFDGVADRPFDQLGAERSAEFEIERARARLLDRATDPEIVICGAEQGVAAIPAVEQHAVAGPPSRDRGGGLDGQALECPDAFARRAGVVGDLLELGAVIDGQRHQARRLLAPRRRPMDVVEVFVAAQRAMRRAAIEEPAHLSPSRIFRRAEQA